jgi:hypothetical protein
MLTMHVTFLPGGFTVRRPILRVCIVAFSGWQWRDLFG